MNPPDPGHTLVRPQDARRSAATTETPRALPADLLSQSAARLGTLALLYAFIFFMAAYVPPMVNAEIRARVLSSLAGWLPGVIAITVALAVAATIRSGRLSPVAAMKLGLAFEVASSYGIATSEYADLTLEHIDHLGMGLSWVAVWTVLFTIVVPSPPRRALITALASMSAVPVVLALVLVRLGVPLAGSVMVYFSILTFQYLLVAVMAYVGARVVYALGTEVSRARELGSYQLVERLGAGGMGEVWRAKHRMLARPAAIKLIRPSLTDDPRTGAATDARRRFEREAQAIASLRSPHTVDLFDFGVADDGAFYYVMEMLEGLDADSLVKRFGPLPVDRTIYVVRQICHSLSEANARGLVHRDIKPANIFLCRYGEEHDFVKVLDFGLVRSAATSKELGPTMTHEHAVHGTPGFIAPEQAMGQHDLDGRVDIYATGCVAYWLLTGQLVFTGDTPMALLMHHAQAVPIPPSSRTENPIPAELDRLILSCLAKNPADRPQSAKALAAALDGIEGAQGWTEARAREWWEQHLPA
jgi:serine/threonine-protein kinase